jgi:hypothetical protein
MSTSTSRMCTVCCEEDVKLFQCRNSKCRYLQCRSCIEHYIRNTPTIVNDIPVNFVPCLNCREIVDLSGCKLNKYDISSIRETINQVKFNLLEKRIRQECEKEMDTKLHELSRKRQKTDVEDDTINTEIEVTRLFPLFEKLLYMRSPCCDLPYTSDGCEAILCDQCDS